MEPERKVQFVDEELTQAGPPTLKVLTVDDDRDFQQSMHFALSNIRILGREIEVHQAYSYSEAATILSADNSFAIALVDVIMETNDAGLRLVKAVRDVLGNSEIRIILVTGQPGAAPMHSVMQDYDLDDYWSKTELNTDRLKTLLTSNTRSYEQMREIARAKRGLQLIAESSGALYSSRSPEELSTKLLTELAKLLEVESDGLVCAKLSSDAKQNPLQNIKIIGATGPFVKEIGNNLSEFPQQEIQNLLNQCLTERQSLFLNNSTCLFFADDIAGADYAVYLALSRRLNPTETELLRVFITNVCGGLVNLALVTQLDRLAYEDTLLKIPNSNALLRALQNILDNPDKRDQFNLLILDIDNFSQINAVLGPSHGDLLLVQIARQLRTELNACVFKARLKDDKFALLGTRENVHWKKVEELFRKEDRVLGRFAVVNMSTVTFPLALNAISAQDVLTRAGIALKTAKKRGIRQHIICHPDNEHEVHQRFKILNDLQTAIERGDINIALQPQLDLKDGKINGVEALARWQREDGSQISPGEFIPIAEASGIIDQLSQLITEKSCKAARALADNGWNKIRVGINLSAMQLENKNIRENLSREIEKAGIHPEQIELEITETVAMQNFERIASVLEELRGQGFRIAIDDFGTGFSSLSYLNLLPVDRLKIDKSFIDNISSDSGISTIADTIIHLGEKFEMNVIAEGVETTEQLEWLREHGCDEVQGYLIAKPMPLDELLRWIEQQPSMKK